MRRSLALLLLAATLVACADSTPEPAPAQSATAAPQPEQTAPATEPVDEAVDGVPPLAAVPEGDSDLWLATIGAPVVAAVRTSTPLAELADMPPERHAATCAQVAGDLDGIAPPRVLTALAITADAETATLLVGDLQAKGELLAACHAGGEDLVRRIEEVAHTHAVAVAWLRELGGGQ